MFLVNVFLIVLIFCPLVALQDLSVNAIVSLDIIALKHSSISSQFIELVTSLACKIFHVILSQIVDLRLPRLHVLRGCVRQRPFDGEAGLANAFQISSCDDFFKASFMLVIFAIDYFIIEFLVCIEVSLCVLCTICL